MSAFFAVYLIWGSTYLGIRFAVESLPPFLMGGARFVIAGLVLYAALRLKGVASPAPAHWRNAAIVGTLLLGGGNGGVCWAEQRVPSNVAALVVGGTPVWFALLDWLRPGGVPPERRVVLGVLVGMTGLALLVLPRHQNPLDVPGAVALLLASLCWATGSLYARYTPKPEMPLMGIALQMITGGSSLLVLGLASGESSGFHWTHVTQRSWTAFVYLTLIGSLVGFTAYSWLIKVTTPAKLSTYAYVNPVIAVFLGWLVADELLTPRALFAAAIIVAAVMIILVRRRVR